MAEKTKMKTTVKSKKTTKAAAPAKAATVRKSRAKAKVQTITQAERQRLVEQAAYFRAEKRGFQGNPHDDWIAAEEEVAADLAKKNIQVI